MTDLPTTMSPATPGFTHPQAVDWVARFATEMAGVLSAQTIARYHRILTSFLDWWAAHDSTSPLQKDLAVQYTRALVEGPEAPRTQALTFAIIRRWTGYLVQHRQVATNPWQDLTAPRQPEELATHGLTLAEIRRLLQHGMTGRHRQRNRLLCRLMLKTGARETELSRICYRDIAPLDADGREALLQLPSKGKHTLEPVLLVEDLKADVDACFHARFPGQPIPPDAPLFVTRYRGQDCPMPPRQMGRLITDALRRAGIKRLGITPLSLRHTAGQEAYRRQASPVAIQAMLRHEDLRTTLRFLQHAPRWRTAAERRLTDI